ncbi:EamA family transporter [Streptacidiphilus sp. PB12-B1b]|uniref:EamA family transporter n=1 Tax=Streptacidiphilus sp. PB12-B1b TaxID=2705012 RepID=UPI0015F90BA2|nr:EamA family transporter [Streptacidiphilus sp. PB12-B1b]QMU76190.1 EamA family transporter [Streptacidiphilus sp. PB12-B1b]
MTALFALVSSALWGISDFGGGLLTRRLPALVVVVASQAAAAAALLVAVAATGGFDTGSARLLYAAAAGVVGTVAMIAFYRALALGPMGVVSPLATVGVVVPVGVGLAMGERPGLLQAAGIAVAAVGVVLAGGPQLRGAPVQRTSVLLTLVAAFGFGTVMALMSQASTGASGLLLALLVQRACNLAVGGGALLRAARREPEAYRLADLAGAGRRTFAGLAAVGIGDVSANGAFVLSSQSGSVAVAAVLASLYPVVTALSARFLIGERLRPVQAAGSGLALAGAILLAAR